MHNDQSQDVVAELFGSMPEAMHLGEARERRAAEREARARPGDFEVAEIFEVGGTQAVRLPEGCRFDADEVLVGRIGGAVVLLPKNDPCATVVPR